MPCRGEQCTASRCAALRGAGALSRLRAAVALVRRFATLGIAALVVGCASGSLNVRNAPDLATREYRCVAVPPLENLSLTSFAGIGFGEVLAAELERRGRYAVLEPMAYQELARELGLGGRTADDAKVRQTLRTELGVDAVLSGTLSEYWYTDDAEVYRDKQPSVGVAFRLIDTRDGAVVWQARVSRTPAAFRGGIVLLSDVAAAIAADVVAALDANFAAPPRRDASGIDSVCAFESRLVQDVPVPGAAAAPVPAAATPATFDAAAQELIDRLKRGDSFVVRGLGFEYRQTTLREGSEEALAALGRVLAAYPSLTVRLTVHTDNQGDPEELRQLTLAQAEALRDLLLTRFGVGAGQLVLRGAGGDEPLLPNINRRNRQINRRVELQIETPPDGGW